MDREENLPCKEDSTRAASNSTAKLVIELYIEITSFELNCT